MLFDLIFGSSFKIFQYNLSGLAFVVLNAVLSYGLAVTTALRLSPIPLTLTPGAAEILRSRIFLMLALASFGLFMPISDLLRLVCIGAITIGIGDLIEITLLGSTGPAGEALLGHLRRPIVSWACVASIGLLYELANHIWPVWRWEQLGVANSYSIAVISVFGYVVLMDACRVGGILGLSLVRRVRSKNPLV